MNLDGVRLHAFVIRCSRDITLKHGNGITSHRKTLREQKTNENDENIDEATLDEINVYVSWSSSFLINDRNMIPGTYTGIPFMLSDVFPYNINFFSNEHNSCKSIEVRSYDEKCPIRIAMLESYERYILIKMLAMNTKQTLKLQNSYGQKGMARYADLSEYESTITGTKLQVVTSIYSQVGRLVCGQLLEQFETLETLFVRDSLVR